MLFTALFLSNISFAQEKVNCKVTCNKVTKKLLHASKEVLKSGKTDFLYTVECLLNKPT